MKRLAYGWLLGLGLMLALPTQAVMLDRFEFKDKAEEERFKDLIVELRCLVCQNQSLLDSDAELAQDLRVETYRLMKGGRSDAEVKDFLVERYGDFVLYRPPLKESTYLLWFGPFVLLVVAGGALLFNIRKRNQAEPTDLSDEQRQRVLDAMNQKNDGEGRV